MFVLCNADPLNIISNTLMSIISLYSLHPRCGRRLRFQHSATFVHACRSKVVSIGWVPCHPPHTTAKLNLHIHEL